MKRRLFPLTALALAVLASNASAKSRSGIDPESGEVDRLHDHPAFGVGGQENAPGGARATKSPLARPELDANPRRVVQSGSRNASFLPIDTRA